MLELSPDLADDRCRCRAFRASAVQSLGQCRQICAAGTVITLWHARGDERWPVLADSWMKAKAFRPAEIETHLRQVLSHHESPIRFPPAPDWAWPFRGDLSRRCMARSCRQSAPTGPARCSRSACRSRADAAAWQRRHERRPCKVLVIDDEPPIRKLLRTGLAHARLRNPRCGGRQTALELLAEKPDLVILDLGLPDIDGLAFKTIRARP